MTESTSTRAERAARLQEQLEGTSQRRGMREMQASPARNLLWGVTLHAAARLDAGLELSDLEQLLAEAVLKLLPEDEVREMGRTWEQARASRALPLFPKAVVSLKVSDSYSFAQLIQDAPALGEEIEALPNSSVVRLDEPGFDDPMDTEEFLAAMSEAGHGVTVVLGPEHSAAAGQQGALREPISVEMYLPYFTCVKGTGDSFLGPDDEVYWTMASGSDKGIKNVYGSPEFGSLQAGQKRNFPPGTALFMGVVGEIIFADIELWEKDRGGFWDTIKDSLANVSASCADSAYKMIQNGEREEAAYFALSSIISGLVSDLLDLILGKDDIIQQRTFSFNRSAIETLIDRSGEFDFTGEGAHYKLRIGARKLPSQMRYITLDAGSSSWSIPQNMPGMHTLDNPGTTSHDGLLYCMVKRVGATSREFTTFDGHIWSTPVVQGGAHTGVGMTVHKGEVRYGTYQTDGRLVAGIVSPTGELSDFAFSTNWSKATPDIVSYKDQLYMLYRTAGEDDTVYMAPIPEERDPDHFEQWEPIIKLPQSDGSLGPAATVHNGVLYVVWRSSNDSGDPDRLWVQSFNGTNWYNRGSLGEHWSRERPALASFNGKLHCVYRGHNNNRLWWTTLNDTGTWTGGVMLEANSDTGPDLAVLDDKLYCVYHDEI